MNRFAHRIHQWRTHSRSQNANPSSFGGPIEDGAELVVAIANNELRSLSEGRCVRSCWAVHAWVGARVTPTWTTRLVATSTMKNEDRTLTWPKRWTPDLVCNDNQLLAKQRVLSDQLTLRPNDVAHQSGDDRTETGRRPDHGREAAHRAVEGSPNPSTDDIEHGPIIADSRRFSSLARCEFVNDPEADASCSQDTGAAVSSAPV
jgi:hypothetical protein